MPAGLVEDAVGAEDVGVVDEGAVLADADGDGVPWRCLLRAADGLGDSEAGTLATAAWKGCPAQDPDPAADASQRRDARGVAISAPVADAGAGTAPRVR
ncbi:MAG TPA: hypothetical protein VGL33_12405 [Streptosporangiaceae bacterium]